MILDKQVSSVRVLQTQTLLAMMVVDRIFHDHKLELIVTSIFRASNPYSLHSTGKAFDFHCFSLPHELHDLIIDEVRSELAPLGYDIVHETPVTTGKPEHTHVEYDPKG